jgi:antagonist of KipI
VGTIEVIRPGLQTTVQDLGRWGCQAYGVPVAGAMDVRSHRIANALLGNPAGAATLEIAFAGPELLFDAPCTVAAAGAEFIVTVDGAPVPMYRVIDVAAGNRLAFGERLRGARGYLAVGGGISVPPVLGSRSTHLKSRMGGIDGRALVRGDRVAFGVGAEFAVAGPFQSRPGGAEFSALHMSQRIRVLPGPDESHFNEYALETLQSGPYVLTQESDRMAFRLEGARLQHKGSADIISDATPLGTIQVPASGQPVLLMADRQTTGGYPRIGSVIAADIPAVAQMGPGDALTFVVCTPAEALAALIEQEQILMRIEGRG